MMQLKPLAFCAISWLALTTFAAANDRAMPDASPNEAAEADAKPLVEEPSGIFLHLGPGAVILDEGATMSAAGQEMKGADISVKSQATAVVEVGVFLTPNFAVSYTGGVPPKATIEAEGAIECLARSGRRHMAR